MNIDFAILENAHKAIHRIRKNDLVELKSLRSPPSIVRFVMEGINILFGVAPEWYYSKKLLLNSNFMRMLLEYDKDNIDDEILDKLEPYVTDLNVSPQKVANNSIAAYALWIYLEAMYKYGRYVQEIRRTRSKLRQEARKTNLSRNLM